MKRIGIFGGTFDPLHSGHMIVAADAHHGLDLDCVLFVVAKAPWQKGEITPASIRYEMVQRALRYVPWASASDVELRREGPTRTIETLQELTKPDQELFLLLGQDQWENRTTWERWEDVTRLATPHVTPRWVGISSTDIRERVRVGRSIKHMVPDVVQMHIEDNDLYRTGGISERLDSSRHLEA